MPKRTDDDDLLLPFPVAPVSNGEWVPKPVTPKQRLAGKLIAEEVTARAKRHGMTRAQFLRTSAATLTGFAVLNKVYGTEGKALAVPVGKEHCDDLDAARELLDRKKTFVMDVQQHHLDIPVFGGVSALAFLRFVPSPLPFPQSVGQYSYVKEVYVDSETTIGVISGLPNGIPLGPLAMATTRDIVNDLAGSERALSQAVCDPKNAPGTPTSIDSLEYQVRTLKGRALKCYTYSGNWRLDDEQIAYPMLAEAQRLGLRLINCHKGLPAIFAPGSQESVRTTDFPKVVRDWPKLKFCAYHSGFFTDADEHPEGKTGSSEFIEQIARIPRKLRKNVYAEIGSTFAITFLRGGDAAAHFIGGLLKALGPKNIIWGTDSIWWGSPQFLIDAFKMLTIPEEMQDKFGYPPLTERTKRLILGLNAAKVYGVKPPAERCTVPLDKLQMLQTAQGGPNAGRSLRWYGPQTRRQFFAMLRGESHWS